MKMKEGKKEEVWMVPHQSQRQTHNSCCTNNGTCSTRTFRYLLCSCTFALGTPQRVPLHKLPNKRPSSTVSSAKRTTR